MYPSARDWKIKHVPQHVGGFRYGRRKGHVNANFDNKAGHKQPRQNDIQNGKPLIEINLSESNTISATVENVSAEYLIDTGASINLIDHDFLHSTLLSVKSMIEASRTSPRVANGSKLAMTGFIVLNITVNGIVYSVLKYCSNLSTQIILGNEFFKKYCVSIDCGASKLNLKKHSQMRVLEKQEIPPHTQSVVRGRINCQTDYQ